MVTVFLVAALKSLATFGVSGKQLERQLGLLLGINIA